MVTSLLSPNPERQFAEWMLRSSNLEICAEKRFPTANEDDVCRAYNTIEIEADPKPELSRQEFLQKREAHFAPQAQPEAVPSPKPDPKQVESKSKEYRLVSPIGCVQKMNIPQVVQYGNFCQLSYFKHSAEPTFYCLIEGWLVVSAFVPKVQENQLFRFHYGDDPICQVHQNPNIGRPAVDHTQRKMIEKVIKQWFEFERKKLWTLFATSVAGGLLFSSLIFVIRNSNDSVDKLLAKAFALACIALQWLTLTTGITLYGLYSIESEMQHVNHVGNWVYQIRLFGKKYPDLVGKYPENKRFFTPKEQQCINQKIKV